MNHSASANIKVDPNGAMTISNEETTITLQPDGTVSISSAAPIQLTGRTLVKLDLSGIDASALTAALAKRLTKKQ